MPIPYRKQKPVRLREMFNSDYQLFTILPNWTDSVIAAHYDQDLDDIIFARYKDILIDPERYLSTLNSWYVSHIRDFDKIYLALRQEYDPLSNYDMIEKEGSISKEGEKISEAKRYGSDRTTQTIPDTKNSRFTTTYDNTTGRLDAYNVEEIQQGTAPTLDGYNAQITEVSQQADDQGKQGSELTEKYKGDVSIEAPESTLEGDKGSERELTRKGNIGVTTQQMLQSEVELRVKYSFINIFCKMFAEEMTLGVWDMEGV